MLSLKEIAESGNVSHSLCLNREVLWDRERDEGRCPQTLNFNLPLPTTFSDGREDFVSDYVPPAICHRQVERPSATPPDL